MEYLFLDLNWRIDIKLARGHHKQKLLVMGLGRRQPNNFEDGVVAALNLVLET